MDNVQKEEKNILVLLDSSDGYIIAGILNELEKEFKCNFYGIVIKYKDDYDFWKSQKILKFKKLWYLPNSYNKKNGGDVSFLNKIEHELEINLWKFVYYERFFYKYNPYHKFPHNEILSILGNTIKLFQTAIKESNPNFVLALIADSWYDALFIKMIENQDIKKYIFNLSRFYNQTWFSNDINGDSIISITNSHTREKINLQELRNELNVIVKRGFEINAKKESIIYKFKIALKFFFSTNKNNFYELYQNYEKTKIKLIKIKINYKLKKRTIKLFLEKKSIKTLPKNEKFVYFPLHVEPERSTLIHSPYYTNQINLIQNLAMSIPIDYKLYVKEHPFANWDHRSVKFYQKILQIPNVTLIHPNVKTDELLQKAVIVSTITGTTGLEALFFKKPVIVFSNVFFEKFSSVKRIMNIEELPKIIGDIIDNHIFNETEFIEFINNIRTNSLEIEQIKLRNSIVTMKPYHRFNESPIPESDFKRILKINENTFKSASNLLKQIIQSEGINSHNI
jgi:capsule polysaccharide modification protein KpsS